MSERSSLACGHTVNARDSAAESESAYENVAPVTQVATSAASGVGRSKLGKKPKPCPKPKLPNYVAVKVAELNSQQNRISTKESNLKPLPPTKSIQRGSAVPTPLRPPAVDRSSKSTNTSSTSTCRADSGVQVGNWSDEHLYETAVRVQLDVLQSIPAKTAFTDAQERSSPASDATTGASGSKTMPIYATPRKPAVVDEPIYDEAEAVRSAQDEESLYDEAVVVDSNRVRQKAEADRSAEDDEPLYDEAVVVDSGRVRQNAQVDRPAEDEESLYDEATVDSGRARKTFEGSDPLYADPDDFVANRAHLSTAFSTTQNPDDESSLYEEAQPVSRMATIALDDVYENSQVLSTVS